MLIQTIKAEAVQITVKNTPQQDIKYILKLLESLISQLMSIYLCLNVLDRKV